MRVCAEGVESEAALEFLRSVECDYAQGYYVSKPIPAVDMTGMLHDWERGGAWCDGRRRPRNDGSSIDAQTRRARQVPAARR